MPGDEIGMEMCQKNVLDRQTMFGGKRQVLIRVALRINNRGRTCRLVSNDVGSVRQARQIELFEDHPTLACGCYFG
jgi:hypothetical protein